MGLVPTRITIDEFLKRPQREDEYDEELIDGEVVLFAKPTKGHTEIVSRALVKLSPLQEQGFVVCGNVACRLSEDSLPNADIGVFRRERWDSVDPEDFVREAPSLAIEVISPRDQLSQLLRKSELYLAHGAEQVWMINPGTRSIEVLEQGGETWEVRDGDSVESYGIKIQVSDLFATPDSNPV